MIIKRLNFFKKKLMAGRDNPCRCSHYNPRERFHDLLSRCRVHHLRQHETGGGDKERPENLVDLLVLQRRLTDPKN